MRIRYVLTAGGLVLDLDLACMRIFITSVGQAMAEDTLPEGQI